MALLKFRCEACQVVFDELVAASRMAEVVCSACGSAKVVRAYEGKCLFGITASYAEFSDCAHCPGSQGKTAGGHLCGGGCACGGRP